MELFIVPFAFLLLIFTIYWYYQIPKNLPPGPLGLPFVGSLPFISKKPYINFIKLSKQYGNLFHIYFGSKLVIVLNDFEAIKEAFVKQGAIFSGRVEEPHRKYLEGGYFGLIQNDGEYWRVHRRFLMSNLRSNGVGKDELEPRIMNEIHYLISEIRKTCGHSIAIRHLLNYSLLNNVLLLANNTRYNYGNEKVTKFIETADHYVKLSKSVAIGTFFPWILKFPRIDVIVKGKEKAREHVNILSQVKKFITTNDDEVSENTYVKAFKAESGKRETNSKGKNMFSENGLVQIARDLLLAGGETSATLLTWALLYLTKYPEVQIKAREEIDKKIGRDREVTYDDRLLTPYVEAVVMETQRIITIAPLGVPHRTIRETSLFGYTIPANTMIFPNLYAVHHDPKLWGDPETYRPERFIDQNGELLKPEYLIPFSIGKRACAGESLARIELYLYLVTLLQNFQLVPTKTSQNLEATTAAVSQPVCDLVHFEEL